VIISSAYTYKDAIRPTTAKKLRGTKLLVPTPGRLRPAPCQRPGWVLGAGGGAFFHCEGPGVSPGKFLKTQMLNPAFWWLLVVIFLAFWKLRPRSWGTNTLLVPQLKSRGTSLPRPLRLLHLCCIRPTTSSGARLSDPQRTWIFPNFLAIYLVVTTHTHTPHSSVSRDNNDVTAGYDSQRPNML